MSRRVTFAFYSIITVQSSLICLRFHSKSWKPIFTSLQLLKYFSLSSKIRFSHHFYQSLDPCASVQINSFLYSQQLFKIMPHLKLLHIWSMFSCSVSNVSFSLKFPIVIVLGDKEMYAFHVCHHASSSFFLNPYYYLKFISFHLRIIYFLFYFGGSAPHLDHSCTIHHSITFYLHFPF